jgi:phage terminase small subunit
MDGLTIKQQKFVDEYIISGNATDAYKKAGYAWNSENTAGVNGHKLLKNHKISIAIAKRSKEAADNRIMDVTEALAISSSIARGEIQRSYSKQYDRIENKVIKEIDYEFVPAIEERQRSLEHILKVNGAFLDRKEITGDISVTFIDDIGSEADGS